MSIARVDIELGLALAQRALEVPTPTLNDLYQSHRVFLYADKVSQAAELARRYNSRAESEVLKFLLNLRQACAEGRVADADAMYADFDFTIDERITVNTRWLALKTLGRVAEAQEALRALDQPEMLFAFTGFLSYPHFDPRPFPRLTAALSAQGVLRENPVELNFACKR